MKITDLKAKALLSLKGSWGLTVGLTFIYFLLNVILIEGVGILLSDSFEAWSNQENTPFGANLSSALISILLVPFNVGVFWFYLNLVRGENQKIWNVFSIYPNTQTSFKMLGATIVQSLFIFLWTLLLIIPGIIKTLAYSQMFYILKDHPEYSILEAITESRKRMNGLKLKYFILGLSFIGWAILSTLTLGIGLLWLIPYTSATMAAFYNENIANKTNESELVETA